MLTRVLVLSIAAAAAAAPGVGRDGGRIAVTAPQKIADRLYVVTGAGGRVAVLATDQGALVVDSGNSPEAGTQVVEAVRGLTSAPIRYLVYTHYHGDHCGGGAAFPASTAILAQRHTRQFVSKEVRFVAAPAIQTLERRIARLRAAGDPTWRTAQEELDKARTALERASAQPYAFPHVTFDSHVVVHLDNDEVHLIHRGPGHTNGDLIVHFLRQRVVHIGDLLFTNDWVPRLDGDAGSSVDNWLAILDGLAAMDVDRFIPGHGEIVDKAGFVAIAGAKRAYLTDLKVAVRRLVEHGRSLEEIKATVRLPKYAAWGMADTLLPWNIEGAYREIVSRRDR